MPQDRAVLNRQSWNPRAGLLVLDEIHKMPEWKAWLKGVIDGKLPHQKMLPRKEAVCLESFRKSGESPVERYFYLHLNSISVREWVTYAGAMLDAAHAHIIERSGSEPSLAVQACDAQRCCL